MAVRSRTIERSWAYLHHLLYRPSNIRHRIPARFRGAARLRQQYYLRFQQEHRLQWLRTIYSRLKNSDNPRTSQVANGLPHPEENVPSTHEGHLRGLETWCHRHRAGDRLGWDRTMQDDEFWWHERAQSLDYIYLFRHSWPYWRQQYEYQMAALVARYLYPGVGIDQLSQSGVGENLSWDEVADQESDLDREVNRPSDEQFTWKWDRPSSPSTEEAYMDYLEVEEMEDYYSL